MLEFLSLVVIVPPWSGVLELVVVVSSEAAAVSDAKTDIHRRIFDSEVGVEVGLVVVFELVVVVSLETAAVSDANTVMQRRILASELGVEVLLVELVVEELVS